MTTSTSNPGIGHNYEGAYHGANARWRTDYMTAIADLVEGGVKTARARIRLSTILVSAATVEGSDEAVDAEVRRAKLDRLPRREMEALRWLGRGGAEAAANARADGLNEFNDLQQQWLALEPTAIRDGKVLTASAFYNRFARDTKKRVLTHFSEHGDKDAAVELAQPFFPLDTAKGWVDDYVERNTEAFTMRQDLKKASRAAIDAADDKELDKFLKFYKAEIKAINDARAEARRAAAAKAAEDSLSKTARDAMNQRQGVEVQTVPAGTDMEL